MDSDDGRGPLRPAEKCRDPEYQRITYGAEYREPQNLELLPDLGLKHKRSLALREFALVTEALEWFVRREPIRQTRERVFGVLAMESEPAAPPIFHLVVGCD